MDEKDPTPPHKNGIQPPIQPRKSSTEDVLEPKTVSLAYKVVSIVIVIAMLATLVFPALVMLRRNVPENCHRGPLGPIHCHTEPIDHDHSIFT